MIVILDYGVGNLTSIRNMIKKAGHDSLITSDPDKISKASKFILPGIGSFDYGITNLKSFGFFDPLQQRVLKEKVPLLGVCLGVQLFTEKSEEGKEEGLGWIKGQTVKFKASAESTSLKIPHMGWTETIQAKESKLLTGMYENPRFYFVHSYFVRCENPSDILMISNYGQEFVSGVEKDNIVGVQFHPEKSHKYGLKIYENFLKHY